MGNTTSLQQHPQNTGSCASSNRPILIDPGCLSCFANLEGGGLSVDYAELQTHNRDLVPKGKVSQASIAFLQKEEIGFLKACSGKNVSALRFYMNKGVNVNLLDEDRTSPLHIACRSGGLQVVEELLNWGATITMADMAGWTPLHIASFYQRSLICHLLLKKGADPYIINRAGETSWDLVKEKNTEEVFYVHFDRAELKRMGVNRKFEPPGEVCEENILINRLAIRDDMFSNRLGIDLRTGGNVIKEEEEEKEGDDIKPVSSIRKISDDGLTETKMMTVSNVGAGSLSRLTARSVGLGNTQRVEVNKKPMKKLKKLCRAESLETKENEMLGKTMRHVSKREVLKENSVLENSTNLPKKHKYYSYFREIKANNIIDFQNNKEVLCTLESEDSGLSARSYTSGNDCSIVFENNLNKRVISGGPRVISNPQNDSTLRRNVDTLPLESYFVNNERMNVNESKSYRRVPRSPSPMLNSQSGIPPYRHSRKFHSHHYYFQPSHQRQSSRENSAVSNHTKRSSMSFVEKTNVSGWSFMLTSPALNIYNLIHREGKDTSNLIKNYESPCLQNEVQTDTKFFELNAKYNKMLYGMGVEIFNHDSIKGVSFLFLFKLLKQNARDIALFLHKSDLSSGPKKSAYQVSQLLTSSQIKETTDILTFYASFFQFQGVPFIDALRMYLKNMILDNDPDKIDHILKGFTKRYYQANKRQYQPIKTAKDGNHRRETFETPEAVHMLAFTTVMLDIDLNHLIDQDLSIDQQSREITTRNEFSRSLAHVNGGESFSQEFIDDLFDEVKNQRVIRIAVESDYQISENIDRFMLQSPQLSVKAILEVMKKGQRIAKEYLLHFQGPICHVVKLDGTTEKLKAFFVVEKCKIERFKSKYVRMTRIDGEEESGIAFAKFKTDGSLGISIKNKLEYILSCNGDAVKIQTHLSSLM